MTSPIAHLLADLPADLAAPVRLREIPFPAQVELRLDDEEAPGTSLPAPGHVTGDGEPFVLWLGPGWYLVVDRTGAEPSLLERLPDAVVVSAARTVLELSGPDARSVLAHGCSFDLHPRVFGPGQCVQTRLAKAQLILHQTGPETYRLLPRSSQAAYLVHWLLEAMTEYVQVKA